MLFVPMDETPSMKQFNEVKSQYPDCIVFFRMGDFYETFGEDAKTTAKILDIVLTSRSRGKDDRPMAGIPYHSLLSYLPKMIDAGLKVAICEQVEDPKTAKGIVKREVVKVITPGTAVDSDIQDPKKNSYILGINVPRKRSDSYGLAYVDISSGSFYVYETKDVPHLSELIENLDPAEVVISDDFLPISSTLSDKLIKSIDKRPVSYVSSIDFTRGREKILEYFSIGSTKGFFDEDAYSALSAGGAVLKYIESTQKTEIKNIQGIEMLRFNGKMYLDPSTIYNLELFPKSKVKTVTSLIEVLDHTFTGMGARLLRRNFISPLLDKDEIQRRLNSVEVLLSEDLNEVRETLSLITDTERISARIAFQAASPRDFVSLSKSFGAYLNLINVLSNKNFDQGYLFADDCTKKAADIKKKIDDNICEEAGILLSTGSVIKEGINKDLDELRYLLNNGKEWLKNFEREEIKKSGINSLKVRYNKVFGYYIEISNAHKEKVPDEYIRKQTLVNAERYITPILKEHEDQILHAQERIIELESRLYKEFLSGFLVYINYIKKISNSIALIDMLSSFAFAASEYGYVKPVIDEGKDLPIEIIEGRHPVIERTIKSDTYIPNDIYLDTKSQQLSLITGPNMAGKSSVIRMVALISFMMQIGSFIPATRASLSIVDRIFSRVGARDNLSGGESTFMVEMNETANILNNATRKSLIVLDEIGRGTSTYDGVSIAYAVMEYIHNEIGAKTLFATHYHELIEMEEKFPRVKNFNILVEENNEDIVFLRKLVRGGTDKSYGIHVAKIAGIPKGVLLKASKMLSNYENNHRLKTNTPPLISLFDSIGEPNDNTVNDEVIEEIKNVDPDKMKPIDALLFIDKLHKKIKKDD